MDSFTQIVLGIATAELVAGKQLKNKTILYGTLLGSLPDIDVWVGYFLDPVTAVSIHRGISHSLLLFLLLSPVLGKFISTIENNKIQFLQASKMVFWCLTTHVLLDVFTSWGTQIFWPLPDRIALKTIFVIDPLYTIPLFISLMICLRKREANVRKKIVLRGIILSTLYLAVSCGIKLFALQKFEKALQLQAINYSDLIVKPTAMNTILWNANVKTNEGYLIGDYSVFDTQPISFTKINNNWALEKELQNNPDFKHLQNISEGWYTISKNQKNLVFNDLRFGILNSHSATPQFVFSYEFKEVNGQLKAFERPKEKREGKKLLNNIWLRLKGN